jgi:hypothetical protein
MGLFIYHTHRSFRAVDPKRCHFACLTSPGIQDDTFPGDYFSCWISQPLAFAVVQNDILEEAL